MKQILLIIIFAFTISNQYVKTYYDNAQLKSQGWIKDNQKTNYWHYYYSNGAKKAEGHYRADKKINFWSYYNDKGKLIEEGHYKEGAKHGWWKFHRGDTLVEIKYQDSKKTGLAILKLNSKIVKAEYYKNGLKTDEWLTLADFKKEYPRIND